MADPRHFTVEAQDLFQRFANRHGLHHVEEDAPVELQWLFPRQNGLVHEVRLALQNNDELNFGVGLFWSYFFPYPTAHQRFEEIIEAWMSGKARVVRYRRQPGRCLQMHGDQGWETIYSDNRWPCWPETNAPIVIAQNVD